MTRILNENDIRAVLTGEAFFGAGGGGSLELALDILSKKAAGRELCVKCVEAGDIPEGGSAVVMTSLYEANSLSGKDEKFVREPGMTAAAMQHSAYMSGKRLEAILPMECGAVSCLFSILCSLESGLALVDADCCGRGVRGIDVTLFKKGGIAFSPAVLCDDKGNVVRVYPYQATSGTAAANMCHYLSAAFGHVTGLGAWITSPCEIKEKLVSGSLSTAEKLGKAILSAKAEHVCICKAIEGTLPVRTLATGKITGKDASLVQLEGEDGKTYCADLSKVTVRFRTGADVLAVCPDLICAVDLDKGLPVTNEEIAVGQRVRYYAMQAPVQWHSSGTCWLPYLEEVK